MKCLLFVQKYTRNGFVIIYTSIVQQALDKNAKSIEISALAYNASIYAIYML